MAIQSLAIFTICSNNYVKMAMVLIKSARKHHPNAKLYLCLADTKKDEEGFYPADCELITAADLEIPEFCQFAFRYDVLEFNTAVKPYMFQQLIKRGHDAVLYFDPDIEIFAPLDDITQRLEGGASFVLTPHLLQPAEGESVPDDVAILLAGVYNLGFLGVGATSEAHAVLAWWARRLYYQCVNDQRNGLFVDQRFIDLVPGFANNVSIVRASNHNISYWNLASRNLTQAADRWFVDGKELVFFHFSGFDCRNRTRLSKHSATFRGNNISSALRALLRHYAEQVISNGHLAARDIPYAYGYFASGEPIPAEARRIFRAQYGDWSGNPFTAFDSSVPLLNSSYMPLASAEELHLKLQAVYASASWRVTKPLRTLSTWFKS
jgi:hypothetical protein